MIRSVLFLICAGKPAFNFSIMRGKNAAGKKGINRGNLWSIFGFSVYNGCGMQAIL
jgi:hypothetical protein